MCIVQYQRFFPDCDFLVYMDDGDALPIALLHSFDRLFHGQFHRNMWICKPRKGGSKRELLRRKRHKKLPIKWTPQEKADEQEMLDIMEKTGKTWETLELERPKQIYINVNKIFAKIMEDPRLMGVVQNPVAFVVGAIVLTGTDYFSTPFLHGLGAQQKIWPVLFRNAKRFAHLVQMALDAPPDPLAWRDVVVDEERFVEFCELCYIENTKNCDTIDQVKEAFAQREAERLHRINCLVAKLIAKGDHIKADEERMKLEPGKHNIVMDRLDMRVRCRHFWWNLLYWANASRPHYERAPDIFQTDDSKFSLFGFTICPITRLGIAAACVSPEPPIFIDETFSRHLILK